MKELGPQPKASDSRDLVIPTQHSLSGACAHARACVCVCVCVRACVCVHKHVHERKACGGRTGESLISVLSDSASASSTLRGWVTILINMFYLRLSGGSDCK